MYWSCGLYIQETVFLKRCMHTYALHDLKVTGCIFPWSNKISRSGGKSDN